jgi:hypothetical protein
LEGVRRALFASVLLLGVLASGAGCKKKPPPRSHDQRVAQLASTTNAPADTKPLSPPPPARATAPVAGELVDGGGVPNGYVRANVASVVSMKDGGSAVLLVDDKDRILPIWIGGSEALSISYRLHGEQPDRPLTHDLLSSLVQELGGRAMEAHVDGLRGTTFLGSVYVEQSGRVLRLEARPSDAIAMALGSGVPIYVAKLVMDEGGVTREELERSRDETLDAKKNKGEPISL